MADPRIPNGARLFYVLRSLPVACDVLYVGSHPDDEENGLIALLTQRHGTRVAYWSATRGEGGQSRVAAYTGDELGVYRTWESLDARQIDGGESLFGPFVDYGFSKNGAEALEKWGENELVLELVRAIRIAQPQLVITRWGSDESGGHGHHTAVGTAVKRAFRAAGEEDAFPELERVGLAVWQPRKLYESMTGEWQPGEEDAFGVKREDLEREGCVPVNTGGFDPISRLTYQEQGTLALQEHLTQGTGSVPTPGDYYLYLRLADVAPGSGLDGAPELFDGIEQTLVGLAAYPGGGNPELRSELARLTELARSAADGFRMDEPWRVARESLELVERLRELEAGLPSFGLDGSAQRALAQYVRGKRADAETAAAGCVGLRMDAALDRAQLSPGETVRLVCRLWSYGPQQPAEIEFRPAVEIGGAQVRRLDEAGDPLEAQFEIVIPPDANMTSPYWLRAPHGEYAYAWPEVPNAARPFDPPLISVTCAVRLSGGESVELTGPALHAESFVGGHREFPLAVLPPISAQPRTTRHTLRSREVAQVLELSVGVLGHGATSPIEGVLEITVPEGWQVEPSRADISLARAGDADSVPVRLTVPANQPPGKHGVRYGIRSAGRLYEASMTAVMQTAPGLDGQPDDGTCVRKQFIARPSLVEVDVIDMSVHEAHSYAYVAGIGDELPRVLSDLGLSVREFSDGDLTHAALAEYDTIVVGPNAFLVRAALRKAAQRLLGYVNEGGTLVVQYQGYDHARLEAAPFPFRYNEPHDRITLETSPVRILQPDHFLFQFPNRIGDDDFSGWVRDRGMYFFGEWDDRYEPLLACADPGESEKLGGLLLAAYGQGMYAYCGYTLFRQLAGGVPGAFRLFANLLALPEARIRRRMERLRTVPLFETLADEGLHRVSEIASERKLSEGEYLFREGDEGTELYIVDEGALDVLRGDPEQLVGTYEAGTSIGELAPLTGAARLASLRARGPTRLFAIGATELTELVRRHPDVADALVRLLARRLSVALAATPAPLDADPVAPSYE